MKQPSLFDPPPEAPVARPPDVVMIRNHMKHLLRLARNAEIMPWHDADARYWEKEFPQMAALLPPGEGAELVAAFQTEFARLRKAA
jgi:hypothetical protein